MADGIGPLYIDECVHSKVAEALRSVNIDAVGAHEVHQFRLSDPEQLEYATAQGRAIVTYNAGHFASLHHEWITEGRPHAGIVLSPRDYKKAVGEFVRDLRASLKAQADFHENKENWIWSQIVWIQSAR